MGLLESTVITYRIPHTSMTYNLLTLQDQTEMTQTRETWRSVCKFVLSTAREEVEGSEVDGEEEVSKN